MATQRYTFVQRSLHWLIALGVFGLLLVGFTFWTLGGYDGTAKVLGAETTGQLYDLHKSFGVLLLILMVLRVALRMKSPPPPYDPPLTAVERFVSASTLALLYLLLIGMPIGGWLATWIGGYPVDFFGLEWQSPIAKNEALSDQLFAVHGYTGLAVAALLLLHIGAGLKHWKLKDGIMRRISLP